eukprot:scaffold134724_cov56-Attheya_sp.AAC.5
MSAPHTVLHLGSIVSNRYVSYVIITSSRLPTCFPTQPPKEIKAEAGAVAQNKVIQDGAW